MRANELFFNKKILLLVIGLAAVFVYVFSIPNHVEKFALIPEKIASGEAWRFLTFQFTHLNQSHLLENIIGVLLAGGIATELKTKFEDFSAVYFLAGILAVIPLFYIINFTVLGASAAIYGVFGLVALEAKKFKIKKEHIFGLLIAAIFAQSAIYYFSCGAGCEQFIFSFKQAGLHFSGLVAGVVIFYSLDKIKAPIRRNKRTTLRRLK